MTETDQNKPDLASGIPEGDLHDGAMLVGEVGGEAVLLARSGAEIFAIGATCTHYGGPLHEGLMVGDTVRCPWHHACFSLRTGEALAAPALNANSCWRVERRDGRIFVREKIAEVGPRIPAKAKRSAGASTSMVIIGGGAAGNAAAEMLRREGHDGAVTILSADDAPPCDRPNLSKDYLAGKAPEEWIPLRPPEFYRDNDIALRLGTMVAGIDVAGRRVILAGGDSLGFDRLLIATGSEPVRLTVPGAELPHVRTLRSLADCRELIARAATAKHAVVVGASFIGLEAAASLRERGVEIHVVAPEARPMERVLGSALGDFLRALHEEHGVVFHLGRTVAAIEAGQVTFDDGASLFADLVVVGIGVHPRTALAERAGLAVERGVLVDETLETSARGIFAAGDIASVPGPRSGGRLRIEHWVVAERQGQTAARNMLGARERHHAVPFFWTQHYDVSIDYVGHAAAWDEIAQDGDPGAHDVALRFRKSGRTLAVATIFRGRESLMAELAMEQGGAA
ncbi:MAG TPA: FAD-dependent oxidoreductase [Rhizomicrobium sp.]|jgi:NADPH-dependent 2,4-dienoyl-CoA reductase/sulfur reductase-like enzyme/nitrite reductase/ring-hydroxylating ferredoxin subunit